MELAVYDSKGKKTSKTVKVSDNVFGIEPNDHAIWLDVNNHMANKRQGNHKAKERAEITGSTRKIKRQKGTGTARAGSIKSPVFRGGGRVFGPRVRDYNQKVNKKVKQLARKSALAYKAKDADVVVLEDLKYDAPKTQNYAALLAGLEMADTRTLLVLPEVNKNVQLSARNIGNTKVVTVNELNTYEILRASKLIICESSVEPIEKILA